MDLNLDILRLARGLAAHASSRQNVIAENVANADTPGYKAKDLQDFAEVFDTAGREQLALRTTRPGHFSSSDTNASARVVEATAFGAESPNGNDVSLEDQMMRSVELRQQHDLAIGVFQKSLDILRLSIGRGR